MLKIAVELVRRAVQANIPFRAVVADSFYGEDRSVKLGLRALGMGYVLALKPSHAWWHPEGAIGSFQEAAQAAGWQSPERPGKWVKVTRTFRDGSSQDWWALEVVTGPYGPGHRERDHRSAHLTRPDDVLVFSPTCRSLPHRGLLIVHFPRPACRRWCDCMGYACGSNRAINRSSMRFSLVTVPGQERPGDTQALATGVLRLLVLLVSCQSWCWQHNARASGGV